MAEKKALQGDLVQVSVNVDKDDVATILMARAEEQLKEQIKGFQAEERRLGKEHRALTKERDAALKAHINKHFEPTLEKLKEAAKGLGAKGIKTSVNVYSTQPKGGKNRQGKATCNLNLNAFKPRINWHVELDAPFSKELREKYSAVDDKGKEIDKNQRKWMAVRKKLSDLPSLERRARAAVAEQRLMASEDGRELISALDGEVANSIKLLGIN